jgi:hypothetical protein
VGVIDVCDDRRTAAIPRFEHEVVVGERRAHEDAGQRTEEFFWLDGGTSWCQTYKNVFIRN